MRNSDHWSQYRLGLIYVLLFGLILSGCTSGGSSSGAGSSIVQGNVASFNVAVSQPSSSEKGRGLASFIKIFMPVKSAFAASLGDIRVDLGQMSTMTNATGGFYFDGVPAGTHLMRFTQGHQIASMSVDVGQNEVVTMTHVRINGHQAHADNVTHMDRDQMGPGTGPRH